MERIIVMGNFILCPMHDAPVISNSCRDCEHISAVGEELHCTYDESLYSEELRIVELITLLLELLETGKTRISLPELERLFPEGS